MHGEVRFVCTLAAASAARLDFFQAFSYTKREEKRIFLLNSNRSFFVKEVQAHKEMERAKAGTEIQRQKGVFSSDAWEWQ
jgi:hypothetical protein